MAPLRFIAAGCLSVSVPTRMPVLRAVTWPSAEAGAAAPARRAAPAVLRKWRRGRSCTGTSLPIERAHPHPESAAIVIDIVVIDADEQPSGRGRSQRQPGPDVEVIGRIDVDLADQRAGADAGHRLV